MRVVIFTDTYPPFINGVSTSCYNLSEALKSHGHEVLIVTPRTTDGPLELKDNILFVPGIAMKNLYGYRLTNVFSPQITKIVKDFEPDVLHNQTDCTVGQLAKVVAAQLKLPTVYTYHTSYEDYTYYITHGFMDRVAKKIVRSYSNLVAKSSKEFITPSLKVKEFMRSVGNDLCINVIPTGIDFSLFKEDKIDKEKIELFKKEHGIKKDTKVFLILGRIAKEKSMDVSIRCIAKYHELHKDQDIKLLVVGNGPQKEELEQLSKDLGIGEISEFVGPVPASEVPFYYHLADIYTSASLTETQGLTFMEAMAASTIVIARFDDNLSGTIIDGKSGFYFTDELSFVEKADKVFSMKEKELNEIKKNALEICDMYSIDKFYENVMRTYKRAIRKCW